MSQMDAALLNATLGHRSSAAPAASARSPLCPRISPILPTLGPSLGQVRCVLQCLVFSPLPFFHTGFQTRLVDILAYCVTVDHKVVEARTVRSLARVMLM